MDGLLFIVFNATFNNNQVISWRSVLLVEEPGVPGENLELISTFKIILVTSWWTVEITGMPGEINLLCITFISIFVGGRAPGAPLPPWYRACHMS
jgi:hypothetical protein